MPDLIDYKIVFQEETDSARLVTYLNARNGQQAFHNFNYIFKGRYRQLEDCVFFSIEHFKS